MPKLMCLIALAYRHHPDYPLLVAANRDEFYSRPSAAAQPRSRGMLTLDFLTGDATAADYLSGLEERAGDYAGFNLLLLDAAGLYYYANTEGRVRELPPGVYGLSNGSLDANWPKQRQAAQALGKLVSEPVDHDGLQSAVSDRAPARDEELPDTGIGRELERALSSQFIVTDHYGTRATTTLAIHRSGQVEFREQSFRHGGVASGQRRHAFRLAC